MKLDQLHQKLIAAARAHPPSDGVPYAFEQRILARIRELPSVDAWTLWARSLWRAATPCVAVMMLFLAWFLLAPAGHSNSTDMSQELENTVLAAADQEVPSADVLR
jgi:hypothetical protein